MKLEFVVQDNYRVFNPSTRRLEYEFGNPSAKQKRAYSRLKSGVFAALHKNQILRFFTLTTANGVDKSINQSWDAFKMRVQRATIKKDGFKGFKMNKYFKIQTLEGNGVLHIVYRGSSAHFLPKRWISKAWYDLHGSPITDIRIVHNDKRLANYLITNYLTKNPIKRMSYGWGWLWRGFCKSWKNMLDVYAFSHFRRTIGNFNNVLRVLHNSIMYDRKTTRQTKLFKKKHHSAFIV